MWSWDQQNREQSGETSALYAKPPPDKVFAMSVQCCTEINSKTPMNSPSVLPLSSCRQRKTGFFLKGRVYFCPHMSLAYFKKMTFNSIGSSNCDFKWTCFFLHSFWPHDSFFPSRSGRRRYERRRKNKQQCILEYSNAALISFLKMMEEEDHMWQKSLYNGSGVGGGGGEEKKMTRAQAITPPSGARTKSPKETSHKHSICARLLKMCSVLHLLYLWCVSVAALRWHSSQSNNWETAPAVFCHDFQPSDNRSAEFNSDNIFI